MACVRAFEYAIGGRVFLGPQEFEASYKGKWELMEQPSWEIGWSLDPDCVNEAVDDEGWSSERGALPLTRT